MKNKKSYRKPEVIRVKLKINNAILAECHSSANVQPLTVTSACSVTTGCYNPPTGI